MSQPSTFAPLRHATFRNIWISSTVSNTGSLIQGVAAAWTMAKISSADMVALVQAATFLPIALLAVPAGALADIYDRRKVQMAALSFSFVASVLLVIASLLDWLSPWALLGFCFLVATGGAVFAPARGASLGEQVPKEQLAQAVGLNNISYNLARSVGPAIGGVIVASVGAAIAFAANALCYLPMLWALKRWQRTPETSRLPPEGLLRSVNSGLRYIAHLQPTRRAVLRTFLTSSMVAALHSLMPLIARDLLHSGAGTFGVLLGFFGAGAVSGIFVLQPLRARLGNERAVSACCLALACAMATLAFSRVLIVDLIALLVAGMAWMVLVTTISIAVQMSVPRWVMGRAIATWSALNALGIAAGSWLWGVLAEAHGAAFAFQIAAVALLLSPALGLLLRIEDRSSSIETDERTLADPDVKLAISGRSGPISIELHYRIASDRAREFYHLMREIQRSRTRNGAYDWSLARNLADPEEWTERFRCPTWDDYLRLRNRRTVDEAALHERAYAMHIGLEPIRVRRWLDRPSGSVRWRDDVPDRGDDSARLQV